MTAAEPLAGRLKRQLEAGRGGQVLRELEDIHVVDIARVLSEMPRAERVKLFQVLDRARAAEVLQLLDNNMLRELLPQLDDERLATILDFVPVHRTVALIARLRPEEQAMISRGLPDDRVEEIGRLRSYREGTAGRLMSPSVLSMPETATVGDALVRIRASGDREPAPIMYVLDEHQHLVNAVSIGRLVIPAPQSPLGLLERRPVISVTVGTAEDEVARMITRYGLWSVPVLDEQWRLAGSISIHDIMPMLQQWRPRSAKDWLERRRRWLVTEILDRAWPARFFGRS